jgi:hypothetical protein
MANLDMDKRSMVKNHCPWTISFTLPISGASQLLGAYKKTSVNNQELVTLCENSNVMFAGTGNGNHARVQIESDDVLKFVGWSSEDGKEKPFILTDEECQKILDYKTISTFKKHVEEKIICNHEKAKIIDFARKMKLNDYDKIVILEEITSIKFKED